MVHNKQKRHDYIVFSVLLLVFCTMILLPIPALADNDADYHIDIFAKGQSVNGPGFFVGNLVQVDGTVDGTAFASGENIQVNGVINGDLFVAGRTITINGTVNGNIYAAGQNLTIGTQSTGDVFFAGQTIDIEKEALIGRDLFAAAQTIMIDGAVKRHLFGTAEDIAINNTIGQNARLEASNVRLMSSTVIQGNLTYISAKQATIDSGATINGSTDWKYKEPMAQQAKTSPRGEISGMLWKIVSALVVWLFITLVWPNFWQAATRTVKEQPLKTIGIGALSFLLTPLAVILLMVTVIGIPLGILTALAYGATLYLTKIITAVVIGSLVAGRFHWPERHKGIWTFLLGLLVITLLLEVPVLRVLVWFLVAFVGLGSLVLQRKKTVA